MNSEVKPARAVSLDVFRGCAIAAMILSSQIVAHLLPTWMSHAQVPPGRGFCPEIPGITWVDLVFPFFLFAMGAAFPFSVGRRIEKGTSIGSVILTSAVRYLKLAFFAIFINHFYPWSLSAPQDVYSWLMALLAFVLLFPTYTQFPFKMRPWVAHAVEVAGYVACTVALLTAHYANGRAFSLSYSNIIILLLGCMAFFGTTIYALTKDKPLIRIAILPFIMGILLSTGDWQGKVLNWTPAPWLYEFKYLKYLFIVLPGSIAGEYLLEWSRNRHLADSAVTGGWRATALAICPFVLIVVNLCGLYGRYLVANLAITACLVAFMYSLVAKEKDYMSGLWKKFIIAGGFCLLLGLFFENFEGGIKKDHSTFSYYFVTSGLAFFTLMAFNIICDVRGKVKAVKHLSMAGQNPMIAYVATALLITPVLCLTHADKLFTYLEHNAFLGLVRGVILTYMAILVAVFFTKIKWFWRT